MKKLFFGMLLFVLTGCASAPSSSIPEIDSFQITRGVCYGTCPGYELEAFKDGRVRYFGSDFVEVKGAQQSKAEAAQFQRITNQLAALDFFNLKSSYYSEQDGCEATPTDMPSVVFTAKTGSEKKEVGYYYGCHIKGLTDNLRKLADLVDEVGQSQQWVIKK